MVRSKWSTSATGIIDTGQRFGDQLGQACTTDVMCDRCRATHECKLSMKQFTIAL